jgi:hypothetical protein
MSLSGAARINRSAHVGVVRLEMRRENEPGAETTPGGAVGIVEPCRRGTGPRFAGPSYTDITTFG